MTTNIMIIIFDPDMARVEGCAFPQGHRQFELVVLAPAFSCPRW